MMNKQNHTSRPPIQIIIASILILGSLIAGVLLMNSVPDRMYSHWNAQGVADGTSSKFLGLFLIPLISAVFMVLLYFIPRIDPLGNIKKFRAQYDTFILVFVIFMTYLHALMLFWNLGHTFDFVRLMLPGFALLIFFCGHLMGYAQRNWFVGVRTPWAISDDENWRKTHILASRLFKAAAVIILVGILVPKYAFVFMILPLIIAGIVPSIYSYVLWKRKHKKNG